MFHDIVALGYAALLAKNQRVGRMVCIQTIGLAMKPMR